MSIQFLYCALSVYRHLLFQESFLLLAKYLTWTLELVLLFKDPKYVHCIFNYDQHLSLLFKPFSLAFISKNNSEFFLLFSNSFHSHFFNFLLSRYLIPKQSYFWLFFIFLRAVEFYLFNLFCLKILDNGFIQFVVPVFLMFLFYLEEYLIQFHFSQNNFE